MVKGVFQLVFFKNKTLKSGYQVFPEFVLTQGAKSLETLEKVRDFLDVEEFMKISATIIIENPFTDIVCEIKSI